MSTPGPALVVLQPSYLPWLGYFDQLRRASTFVVYDDVQYDKHGWRNRNRIKTAQGVRWLTVPTLVHGQGRPRICDVRIDNTRPWARTHMRSLQQAYARAPFAGRYLPALEDVLMRDWKRLVDLDVAVLRLLASWLDISTPMVLASAYAVDGDRSARLVALCHHFSAVTYFSGEAAQDYLDLALFARAGITVEWQAFAHPVYPQLHGPFVSHLSAIDAILNCGPDSGALVPGRPTLAD